MGRTKTFGRRIRNLREKAPRTSLRALAEVTGISRGYLCQIEKEQVPPPTDANIAKLASALGEKTATLFALAGRVTPPVVRAFRLYPEKVERLCRAISRIRKSKTVERLMLNAEIWARQGKE